MDYKWANEIHQSMLRGGDCPNQLAFKLKQKNISMMKGDGDYYESDQDLPPQLVSRLNWGSKIHKEINSLYMINKAVLIPIINDYNIKSNKQIENIKDYINLIITNLDSVTYYQNTNFETIREHINNNRDSSSPVYIVGKEIYIKNNISKIRDNSLVYHNNNEQLDSHISLAGTIDILLYMSIPSPRHEKFFIIEIKSGRTTQLEDDIHQLDIYHSILRRMYMPDPDFIQTYIYKILCHNVSISKKTLSISHIWDTYTKNNMIRLSDKVQIYLDTLDKLRKKETVFKHNPSVDNCINCLTWGHSCPKLGNIISKKINKEELNEIGDLVRIINTIKEYLQNKITKLVKNNNNQNILTSTKNKNIINMYIASANRTNRLTGYIDKLKLLTILNELVYHAHKNNDIQLQNEMEEINNIYKKITSPDNILFTNLQKLISDSVLQDDTKHILNIWIDKQRSQNNNYKIEFNKKVIMKK